MRFVLFIGALLVSIHQPALAVSTSIRAYFPDLPESETYHFDKAPRLSKAVERALSEQGHEISDIYWTGAALFDLNLSVPKKQDVLLAIKHATKSSKESERISWTKLGSMVQNMHFAHRVFIPLDPDLTRISPSDNPLLTGNWQISLPAVPHSITVLGNVSHPGKYTWQQRASASFYLDEAGRLQPDISDVWVIQPDGNTNKHPVAYWNFQFSEVAPGAIIYVPFKHTGSLFTVDTNSVDVNLLIVELLRNKLP